MDKKEKQLSSFVRHPVVVVLGHVDHGKTTLLDYIRKSNVVARESGGITQHLGAYEIEWNKKKITFLDTPGHASFSKMRERGAHVADVAIVVVAADDSVKPQTIEALGVIQKAGIPFVIAINKTDKPASDIDRVKADFAQAGALVEGWGGSIPVVAISAKEGTNIDGLLDTVLLVAELEELRCDPSKPAQGVIIESHLDARRGPSAVLLVTDGTLKKSEFVLAKDAFAPVRILEDVLGHPVDSVSPSSPARVAGFNKVPVVGNLFTTFRTKDELEKNIKTADTTQRDDIAADVGILIKADVAGSLEALESEIKKNVPSELPVKFFEGGVGEITEGNVKSISSAKTGMILGFRTKAKPNVCDLAERFNVSIHTFDVIYEAVDWIRERMENLKPKILVRENTGKLLVLKTFRSKTGGRIIGGKVNEGKVPKDANFEVTRQENIVARGYVMNLERNKAGVDVLREGEEGGLLVSSPKAIEERDVLVFFYERESR